MALGQADDKYQQDELAAPIGPSARPDAAASGAAPGSGFLISSSVASESARGRGRSRRHTADTDPVMTSAPARSMTPRRPHAIAAQLGGTPSQVVDARHPSHVYVTFRLMECDPTAQVMVATRSRRR